MATLSHLLKRIRRSEEQESFLVIDTITVEIGNIYNKFHDRIYCHSRLLESFYKTGRFTVDGEVWAEGLGSILNERTMNYIRRNRGLRGTYIKEYVILMKLAMYLDDIIRYIELCHI